MTNEIELYNKMTITDELKDRIIKIKPFTRYDQLCGFHVIFKNNWLISIQFGPGNYCDNYNGDFYDTKTVWSKSSTVEIAYWNTNAKPELSPFGTKHVPMQPFEESGDTVLGYQTFDQVLEWMEKISQLPEGE